MKPESQDEKTLVKFVFGSLIIDQTIYCKLGIKRNKRVYNILNGWIEKYEEEEKLRANN